MPAFAPIQATTASNAAPRIQRRAVIAGCAGLAAWRTARAAALAVVPATENLVFQVSRNGSPIGAHRVIFRTTGGGLTAQIDAAFTVGFGFITLYRYHHQAEERWRDGVFQSLRSTTNDNGKPFTVDARRVPNGILIRATGLPNQLAPANALPLTHWAIAAMDAPLFNPETGEMLREAATPRGAGTVKLADGTPIAATGYALGGEAPIEDWYDKSQIWAALNAQGKDGSTITYRRA